MVIYIHDSVAMKNNDPINKYKINIIASVIWAFERNGKMRG